MAAVAFDALKCARRFTGCRLWLSPALLSPNLASSLQTNRYIGWFLISPKSVPAETHFGYQATINLASRVRPPQTTIRDPARHMTPPHSKIFL